MEDFVRIIVLPVSDERPADDFFVMQSFENLDRLYHLEENRDMLREALEVVLILLKNKIKYS